MASQVLDKAPSVADNAGMGKRRGKQPNVSDQIRAAIETSGLTRYRIWKKTGIDQAVLSKFMLGQRGISMESLDKLGELLHLEVRIRGRRR